MTEDAPRNLPAELRRDAMELVNDSSREMVAYALTAIYRKGDASVYTRRMSWHGTASVGELIGALEVAKRRLIDHTLETEEEVER